MDKTLKSKSCYIKGEKHLVPKLMLLSRKKQFSISVTPSHTSIYIHKYFHKCHCTTITMEFYQTLPTSFRVEGGQGLAIQVYIDSNGQVLLKQFNLCTIMTS